MTELPLEAGFGKDKEGYHLGSFHTRSANLHCCTVTKVEELLYAFIFAQRLFKPAAQTMNSTDCWAFARLCCMYPVLTGIAAWYFLRGDYLVRTLKARRATRQRRTRLHH